MPTLNEIDATITAEVTKIGISLIDLRQKNAISWFPRRNPLEAGARMGIDDADLERNAITRKDYEERRLEIMKSMSPTVITRRGPFPMNPAFTVMGIFETDTSWKVYALPVAEDNKPRHPTCYSLSKSSNVYDAEQMSLATFIAEIVNEWSMVDGEVSSREREKEAICSYLEALPPEYTVKEARLDIIEDIHLEEDEGPEDEETEEEEPEPAVSEGFVPPEAPAEPSVVEQQASVTSTS